MITDGGRSRLGWKELRVKDTQAGEEGSKSAFPGMCFLNSLCDPGLTSCSLSVSFSKAQEDVLHKSHS